MDGSPSRCSPSVHAVDGVAGAQVDIAGYAQIVDKAGDLVGNPQNGPPTVGSNWSTVPDLNPWRLVAGRPPKADDEVVLDRKTAEVAGYDVGDTANVVVMGPPQTVRITGIVAFGAGGSTGGAAFVIFTTPAAARFLGEPGRWTASRWSARKACRNRISSAGSRP